MKNDLNLVPRKAGKSPFLQFGIVVIVVGLLLAASLAAGIIIPNRIKQQVLNHKQQLTAELANYSQLQADFDKLNSEIATLDSQIKSLDNFKADDKGFIKMLDLVQSSCPSTITVSSVSFDYEKVSLAGTCTNSNDISRYAVKLRSSGLFENVYIDYVNSTTSTDGSTVVRTFNIQLYYPAMSEDTGNGQSSSSQASGGQASSSQSSSGQKGATSSESK